MSRDLEESKYYISQGGLVPIKWTAPEVIDSSSKKSKNIPHCPAYRQYFTGSIQQLVMCGAMVC